MKRVLLLTFALLACSSAALAQPMTAPSPPPVIVVVREDIKPGKMPAHEQEARHFVHVQARANARLPAEMREGRLAMTPIAGNENEVLYLWPYMSFADIENKRKETGRLAEGAMKADFEALPDNELHAAQFDSVARLRSDLSSNLGKSHVAQARYMAITTLRLKPGMEDAYWAAVKKITWPAREKAGDMSTVAVYQVSAGAPATTYLLIRPMKSLAEMDTPVGFVRNAMGDNGREELDKVRDKAVMFSNTSIYQFNPRLSLVGKEFAAADTASPAFWITDPAPPGPPANARRAVARRNGRQ